MSVEKPRSTLSKTFFDSSADPERAFPRAASTEKPRITKTTQLPSDLLQKTGNRIAWISAMYAVGFLLGFGIPLVTVPGFETRDTFPVEALTVSLSILVALTMFGLARSGRVEANKLLDLALLFEVVAGFGAAMTEQWGIFGLGIPYWFGISWLALWIVVFAILVPATPGKMLLAAVATASTSPLAHLLSFAFGSTPALPFYVLVQLFFPLYVAALIAFLAARILYRLGVDVEDARDLGRYHLIELLGEGGMGEVWKAYHHFLARPTAIKLIRAEVFGKADVIAAGVLQKRFELEAQAAASLHSPHSITIFDFGSSEDGRFYYAMELLEGMDLQRLVTKHGPLPAPRVIHILRQMCHSLVDAHDSGVVHRDIKPANILLCRLGFEYDYVKILDFGLAKFREEAKIQKPGLTTSGDLVGTPAYLAPERIGGGEGSDPRSDLYSLGCVAYWLLTGQLVFEENSQQSMLVAQLQSKPVPPANRTELEIPEEVDQLVLACLSKQPSKRPQSARELLDQLDGLAEKYPWSGGAAQEWWTSHAPSLPSAR